MIRLIDFAIIIFVNGNTNNIFAMVLPSTVPVLAQYDV